MIADTERQELEMRYAFPETLIENSIESDNRNGLVISYGGDTPVSEEATSVEVLKSVVREGIPGHCLPKFDTLFEGKNLMAVSLFRGADGDIFGGPYCWGQRGNAGAELPRLRMKMSSCLTPLQKGQGSRLRTRNCTKRHLRHVNYRLKWREARKIQVNLIPDTLPDIPGYEIAGHYEPRGPVGGDYYDCIPLPTGHWGLAIADVSGKGMQAALLMATLPGRADLGIVAGRKCKTRCARRVCFVC